MQENVCTLASRVEKTKNKDRITALGFIEFSLNINAAY